MQKIAVIACFAGSLLIAAPPLATAQAPSAAPEPTPPVLVQGGETPRMMKARATNRPGRRSRVHEDARHCLDTYESDLEAMRCAEKYRY